MLFPEPLTPSPHFNICVSSHRGEGEGGWGWVEGEREHSDLSTDKTAAVAESQRLG